MASRGRILPNAAQVLAAAGCITLTGACNSEGNCKGGRIGASDEAFPPPGLRLTDDQVTLWQLEVDGEDYAFECRLEGWSMITVPNLSDDGIECQGGGFAAFSWTPRRIRAQVQDGDGQWNSNGWHEFDVPVYPNDGKCYRFELAVPVFPTDGPAAHASMRQK